MSTVNGDRRLARPRTCQSLRTPLINPGKTTTENGVQAGPAWLDQPKIDPKGKEKNEEKEKKANGLSQTKYRNDSSSSSWPRFARLGLAGRSPLGSGCEATALERWEPITPG
ncbi:hypothetical protein N7462_003900 [Penicillium macrosclerotiorum]|uniref:uncharacterized protein n=1 Tax=Penicillium macrosclerotiorum TaxID=303699 RepID=UPI0025473F05|nr:uncharacterized protein N7462_003900 [Penicillium macrosclerotiorum]KAJ5689508.1 hypothetical protein N7462_003900 [Penicillium macrosclerotiorum]